jgi:hypothetical protein
VIVPDAKNPQSLNRFSYVCNNPLRYWDPTGHCGADADATLDAQCESLRDGLESDFEIDITGTWTFDEMQFLLDALGLVLDALDSDQAVATSMLWLLIRQDRRSRKSARILFKQQLMI